MRYAMPGLAIAILCAGPAIAQQAQQPSAPAAQATYAEIERSLGSVPTMFRAFPEPGIAGAWAEFRDLQMNPGTALPNKVKELIGLAVAAQIPCACCVHFHTSAARANGATDAEIREAIGMAAVTRHWSTVLNGSGQELADFRRETDAIFARTATPR